MTDGRFWRDCCWARCTDSCAGAAAEDAALADASAPVLTVAAAGMPLLSP